MCVPRGPAHQSCTSYLEYIEPPSGPSGSLLTTDRAHKVIYRNYLGQKSVDLQSEC